MFLYRFFYFAPFDNNWFIKNAMTSITDYDLFEKQRRIFFYLNWFITINMNFIISQMKIRQFLSGELLIKMFEFLVCRGSRVINKQYLVFMTRNFWRVLRYHFVFILLSPISHLSHLTPVAPKRYVLRHKFKWKRFT